MGLFFHFSFFITASFAAWSWADIAAHAVGFDTTSNCGFTRQDALECIKQHVDANHDNEISCEEFQRAKTLFLPPRARAALWIAKKLGMDVQFEQVLYGEYVMMLCDLSKPNLLSKIGCDFNKDCRFTEEDWLASQKKCLPGASDLCKLKTACDVAAKSTEEYTVEMQEEGRAACEPFTLAVCHQLEEKWIKDDALAAYLKNKK